MDMVQIGQFLSELRKAQGWTQAQLGERLGVSNKTVSRWETGMYLPPVEMLLELSRLYGISINELLSGTRLTPEEYPQQAEENLRAILRESAFTKQERADFFRRKYNREHCFDAVLTAVVTAALLLLGICRFNGLEVAAVLLGFCGVMRFQNRRAAYIEAHLYPEGSSTKKVSLRDD